MNAVTVELSSQELAEILQAYQTIGTFLEKIVAPNELYRHEFLKGLQTAVADVREGRTEEVETYDDFIR